MHRARRIHRGAVRYAGGRQAPVQCERALGNQKWIEALRDNLAELISLYVAALAVKQRWKGKWDQGLGAIAMDRELMAKLERIVLVQWKIRLLINPAEEDHEELYRTIEAAFERLKREEFEEAAAHADVEKNHRADADHPETRMAARQTRRLRPCAASQRTVPARR